MALVSTKKKRPRCPWKEDNMKMAISAVKERGLNVMKASQKFNVPRTTLQLRLKDGKGPIRKRMGPECTMGQENEEMLANWVKGMAARGFPVTALGLLSSAKKIVEGMGLKTTFKDARPGTKWKALFLQRHNISMRSCEKLTSSRAMVKEIDIRKWFMKVKDYIDEKNLNEALEDPNRVYNMDESGFLLCPKGEKVLAIKGQRNVYEICSSNEKESVTVLLTVSASGKVGPSLVVYPGQRYPKNLENFIPDNWAQAKTEKGWITGETFYEYIVNVFHKWLLAKNVPMPIILFMDGHSSHLTLHLSDFAAANGIEIIALYPNSTHILQPLDVIVFGPLKKKYAQKVKEWKIENETLVLDKIELPMVLDQILRDDLDKSAIVNGFRGCGLNPFNPDNVDYSKRVASQVSQVNTCPATPTIDRRKHEWHKHVENLIGPELVSKFKEGKGDETCVEYAIWLKSKRICFAEIDHEDVPIPLQSQRVGVSSPVEPPSVNNLCQDEVSDLVGTMETTGKSFNEPNPPENRKEPKAIPETSSKLAKILSPATGGEGVPTHIKKALYWPGTPTKKRNNLRRSLNDGFPVITSEAFRTVKSLEKKKKTEEAQLKEEKKRKRLEMKQVKEVEKQAAAKRKEEKNCKKMKPRPRKQSETESSDSSAEVTSGESTWHESESQDDEPNWVPAERKEGEHVVVSYDRKYFPGVIRRIKKTGAFVAAMTSIGQLWKWPQPEDVIFYPWEDIVSRIEAPRKTSSTRDLFSVKELHFQNSFHKA